MPVGSCSALVRTKPLSELNTSPGLRRFVQKRSRSVRVTLDLCLERRLEAFTEPERTGSQ